MEELEFKKLESDDRKMLFYMMDNRPHGIRSWIEQLARAYQQKGVTLNANKLYAEVAMELKGK